MVCMILLFIISSQKVSTKHLYDFIFLLVLVVGYVKSADWLYKVADYVM